MTKKKKEKKKKKNSKLHEILERKDGRSIGQNHRIISSTRGSKRVASNRSWRLKGSRIERAIGEPAHRCRGRALRFSWPDVNAGNIAMLAPMVDARVTGADWCCRVWSEGCFSAPQQPPADPISTSRIHACLLSDPPTPNLAEGSGAIVYTSRSGRLSRYYELSHPRTPAPPTPMGRN